MTPTANHPSWSSRNPTIAGLFRNRAAACALCFLVGLVVIAIAAPLLAPYDPSQQDIPSRLQAPSWNHPLGTDQFGRDAFSRMIFATRVVVAAAAQGVSIAVGIGVTLGMVAGYAAKSFDIALSFVFNALLSFPALLLAFAIVGLLGPSLRNAIIAVGIVLSPTFFRVARGTCMSARREPFVETARSNGCTEFRILWRHLLPNVSSALLVQTSFATGFVIVAEASLSFLGLGVQAPAASWGSMLSGGFELIDTSAYLIYPPAAMIALTVLATAVLGDGIRDALAGQT